PMPSPGLFWKTRLRTVALSLVRGRIGPVVSPVPSRIVLPAAPPVSDGSPSIANSTEGKASAGPDSAMTPPHPEGRSNSMRSQLPRPQNASRSEPAVRPPALQGSPVVKVSAHEVTVHVVPPAQVCAHTTPPPMVKVEPGEYPPNADVS